jgi:SAM-dependent methyltransferase
MPSEDAERWNLRYQADPINSSNLPRSLFLEHTDILPSHGLALDIAMGLGGNATFLITHGLRVIGVDISYVAVCNAKSEIPTLMAVVPDLELFYIPQNTFDVILDFLYLQRNLWEPIVNGLIVGGILFIECLTEGMITDHPEIDPVYLLKPDELRQTFFNNDAGRNLEILYYYEGSVSTTSSHHRTTASLIARRIA